MRIFYAGAEVKSKRQTLYEEGVRRVLYSYYHAKGKKSAIPRRFDHVLLDSGGYTARKRGVKISVKEYADYINEHGIKLAFELDTDSALQTSRNREYLTGHANSYIIPIYHYDDYLQRRSLLDDFIRDYPFISIGGFAGMPGIGHDDRHRFFKYVFSKTRDTTLVHGLGVTERKYLRKFPFYSIDSTTWLQLARYGKSTWIEDDFARERAFARKFDNEQRVRWEIRGFLKFEKQLRELWRRRGVEFDEFRPEEHIRETV